MVQIAREAPFFLLTEDALPQYTLRVNYLPCKPDSAKSNTEAVPRLCDRLLFVRKSHFLPSYY